MKNTRCYIKCCVDRVLGKTGAILAKGAASSSRQRRQKSNGTNETEGGQVRLGQVIALFNTVNRYSYYLEQNTI